MTAPLPPPPSTRPPRDFRPEPFPYHHELELEITTLTNLGDGLGRMDGWVVMVPFALPGERIRVRIWRNHKNHSDGDLVAILRPSPDRVTPRCPLFGNCGGCQYQHLADDAQLRWKRQQVAELLARLGGLPEVPVLPPVASPQTFGYRSKLTPHGERPRPGVAPVIGFQRAASRALVDVAHCPIATPAINAALPAVRAAAASQERQRAFTLLLRDCAEGVVTDPRAIVHQQVGPLRLQFPAGEFFQNNPFILEQFVDYAVREAAAPGLPHLVDAYCGSGLFALWAAPRFAAVVGVEVAEIAVHRARANAAANGLGQVRFVAASAEHIFAELPFAGDTAAVLLDPPRAGCSPEFLQQLVAFGPLRVVYVSCAPDTQARDLKILAAQGYRVRHVQPFDLFPQTRHIETIATLDRVAG